MFLPAFSKIFFTILFNYNSMNDPAMQDQKITCGTVRDGIVQRFVVRDSIVLSGIVLRRTVLWPCPKGARLLHNNLHLGREGRDLGLHILIKPPIDGVSDELILRLTPNQLGDLTGVVLDQVAKQVFVVKTSEIITTHAEKCSEAHIDCMAYIN
jgi:hypothetical protein